MKGLVLEGDETVCFLKILGEDIWQLGVWDVVREIAGRVDILFVRFLERLGEEVVEDVVDW